MSKISSSNNARIWTIVDILQKQFPSGELKYVSHYYGWYGGSRIIPFQAVDYSLQNIGGADDIVRVWNHEGFDLTIPAGTLPTMKLEPMSETIKNFRYIEGIE